MMVQLIKKGGLRERANRSRSYQGSENTEASLKPNRYRLEEKTGEDLKPSPAEAKLPAAAETPEA